MLLSSAKTNGSVSVSCTAVIFDSDERN